MSTSLAQPRPVRARLIAGLKWLLRPAFRLALRMVFPEYHRPGMSELAEGLERRGWLRPALWYRRRILERHPYSGGHLSRVLRLYFRLGRVEGAERFLADYSRSRRPPRSALVYLAGEQARAGRLQQAGETIAWLTELHGDKAPERSPSPMREFLPRLELLRERLGEEAADGSRDMGRLCLAFGRHETAAALLGSAEKAGEAEAVDRVGRLHALACSGQLAALPDEAERASLAEEAEQLGADWLFLMTTVELLAGSREAMEDCLARSVRLRYAGHPELEELTRDAVVMGAAIFALGETLDQPVLFSSAPPDRDAGIPKVFVCGFGWSGSGAVHDALRGHEAFCEFPGVQPDPVVHPDALSEMPFIQSSHGLGRLWRRAKEDRRIGMLDLWDLFRCHVIGGSYSGYSEYKAVNAARHLVDHFGARYTGIFRECFVELERNPPLMGLAASGEAWGLRERLQECTEALCRMLVEESGRSRVLFNNAVFGRNQDMLDIFRNVKSVVVDRDVRDVYVDRCRNDGNHWRNAAQFLPFYESGRRRCQRYLDDDTALHRDRVRWIRFEDFVLDDAVRDEVLQWLTDGCNSERDDDGHGDGAGQGFDPRVSRQNIGIHRKVLSEEEAAVFGESSRE